MTLWLKIQDLVTGSLKNVSHLSGWLHIVFDGSNQSIKEIVLFQLSRNSHVHYVALQFVLCHYIILIMAKVYICPGFVQVFPAINLKVIILQKKINFNFKSLLYMSIQVNLTVQPHTTKGQGDKNITSLSLSGNLRYRVMSCK